MPRGFTVREAGAATRERAISGRLPVPDPRSTPPDVTLTIEDVVLDLIPYRIHRAARLGLALAATVTRLAGAQRLTQTDSAIKAVIEARVGANRNAGIVVGVLEPAGSRIVAAGVADEGRSLRLDGNTVFEIGSVSKVFTGALLADMVKRGEVRLDDPVQKYLPPSVTVPARDGKQITLLDLATHRSGLPRMPSNFNPQDSGNPYADYTVEQMYAFLSSHTLTRDIGAAYEYSNLAVGLLGHVLSLRTGKSYEELLVERILRPLGMNDTRVTLTPAMRERLARGHFVTGAPAQNWDLPTFVGAGGIRSTANDMLTFLAANLDPRTDGLPAALRAAHVVQREGAPAVGLNWHLNRRRGREFVWHNGETGGYHSYVALDHDTRTAVVVLTNTAFSIDGIGLWVLDTTTTLTRLDPIPVRKEASVRPALYDEYAGTYRLTPTVAITVTRSADALFIQLTGQGRLRVLPESDTKFFLREVDAQISFVRDGAGKVTELILHQNGADKRAARVP